MNLSEVFMLKKVLSALLLTTLFCCGCGKKEPELIDTLSIINQRDKIIVGVKTDTPPFGFLDKEGKNAGFDIDLARLIAKKLLGSETKVEFVAVNTSNRIMKLASEEVDMVAATMSITPQRQMILDFSVPYHTERNLRSNVPNITITGYKTYPEAFAALDAGKADAMISDDTILMGHAYKNPNVKILPKRYSKEPYAIAFRKGDEKLIEAINTELKELINRGEVRRLKEKWGIN